MPPQQKKTETKKPESTSSPKEESSTPPEESFIDQLETEIDELFKDIEELDGPDKIAFLLYLAQRISKHGFAVIKIDEFEEAAKLKTFNASQLFNTIGVSKNPRLDTLQKLQTARKYGRAAELGDSTAREFVLEILNRAGVPDGSDKDDLIKFFEKALLLNIPDPVLWQNPLWGKHLND